MDIFYGLGLTQSYQMYHSLSLRLLKHFFDDVLLEHGELAHVLPLAVHLDLVGWVAHKILETAQSPNSPYSFLFDFGLGLRLVNNIKDDLERSLTLFLTLSLM